MTRPTEAGRNAKFIYAEIDDKAAAVQEALLDLLEKQFQHGGRDGEMKIVLRAVQDITAISRMATLMRSGRIQDAEQAAMGIRKVS